MRTLRFRYSLMWLSAFLFCNVFYGVGFAADPIVFNDNGVWCWFQDERAIVHNNKLIIGSVADASGTDGSSRDGNIEVVQYDLSTSTMSDPFVLHANLNSDDHAAPAFLVLPDEKILTIYATHGNDVYMRYRITSNAGDATAWDSEQTYTAAAGVTYSNVYRLSEEDGRIYNFYRGENYNPNFLTSDDNGQSWNYGRSDVSTDGRLIAIGSGGTRPYVKYTSNGTDKIHFISTEAHPRNYSNSIYYGYLSGGKLYNASGTLLHDTFTGGIAPASLEKIYKGGSNNVGWTTDIALDDNGYPYCAFSVQMNQTMEDIRYWYARFDGTDWHTNEIAYAGSALYSAESDYSGLVALDPANPNVLYISADVHPETGKALISSADNQRHYEIFKGTTADMGATWTWQYITRNSTEDNIRPIIPAWEDGTILLWCKGTYTTYLNWDMDVVGLINPEPDQTPNVEQLDSVAVPTGKTAKFKVNASGDGTLSYQWYKVEDGTDTLLSADSSVLLISDVQSSDFGKYYCIVSNSYGSTISTVANLTAADILAYWPLNSDYTDHTGNGYNAVAAGTSTPSLSSDAFSGNAISFDGSSYLDCDNGEQLSLANGGTISVWIKADPDSQVSSWASIAAKGRYSWRLCRNGYGDGDSIAFHFNSPGSAYQANGSITAMDSTWHHVAVTYDGSTIKLYIDAKLDVSVTVSEAVNDNTTDPVYIGNRSDADRFWVGMMDEIRIYDFAMDQDTIELLYNQNLSCYQPADFDLSTDGHIDTSDLIGLADTWLINDINLEDFAELATDWLNCYLLPTTDCTI